MIELRSDTFTMPTREMIVAMSKAPLGDDVYGEDPTVCKLELIAAELLGHESAIFMPSGTMANLASILAHCNRGDKVYVGDESDIFIYEAGGASVCGGVVYDSIPTRVDGTFDLHNLDLKFQFDPEDPQFSIPRLICTENTHNRLGGKVLPLTYLAELKEFANHRKVRVHMDGARIFNAAIYLGVDVKVIARMADSVQFCLSKGLSAPVGSIVTGDTDFVERVRRIRKMLGGSMRQAGVLAAAGIVALETMVERLAEDHENARLLAEGLANISGVEIDPKTETNIVFFKISNLKGHWRAFIDRAHREGVSVGELGYGRIRAVTHRGVTKTDIYTALHIIQQILY